MQIGATFDKQQALDGAVDKVEVADGGTYSLPLAYLPTSSRPVYIVVEVVPILHAGNGGTLTLSGDSDLTHEATVVGGDYYPASASPSCGERDIVRLVFSRTDDGNETAVSEELTIDFGLFVV
jgi:hypothetical protein